MSSNLPDIPLLQGWLDYAEEKGNTTSSLSTYISQQLSGSPGLTNVDVPGSSATAFYSGNINGERAFQIARDLAERSEGQLRIIDNTNIGKFLDFILFQDEGADFRNFDIQPDYIDARFSEASVKFALETKGPVITITPEASADRVFSRVEVENLLKSDASIVNGRSLDEIRAVVDQLGGPDSEAGRAYAKSQFDGDFARILAQGSDNSLQIGTYGGALDLDFDTQTKLGIDHVSFTPASGSILSTQDGLTDSLKSSAARGLAAEIIFLGNTDNPSNAVSTVGFAFEAENEKFSALRHDIIRGIDQLEAEDWRSVQTFDTLIDKVKDHDIQFFAGWGKGVFEKLSASSVDVFGNAADDLRSQSVRSADLLKRFTVDEGSSIRLPELSSFREITPDIAAKALGVAAAAAFGILKFHTASVKYGGTDTPEFQEWLKSEAVNHAIGLPIFIGALYMAAGSPLGMAVLIGGGTVLGYFEIKEIVQDIVDNRQKYAEGSLIVSFAELALSTFEFIEQKFEPAIQMGARVAEAFFEGFDIVVDKLADLSLPEVKLVGGTAADFVSEEGSWLVGFDAATLIGSTQDDTLTHTGAGEVLGLSGNDILVGLFPDYIEKGSRIGPKPAEGAEDTRPVAETDLRLTLNGGEGDDYLIALGGTMVVENYDFGKLFENVANDNHFETQKLA